MAYILIVNRPGYLPDDGEPAEEMLSFSTAQGALIDALTFTYSAYDDSVEPEVFAEAMRFAASLTGPGTVMLAGYAHTIEAVERKLRLV